MNSQIIYKYMYIYSYNNISIHYAVYYKNNNKKYIFSSDSIHNDRDDERMNARSQDHFLAKLCRLKM